MKKYIGIALAVLMVLGLATMGMAGNIRVSGDGEYNQTTAFGGGSSDCPTETIGNVSDSVTLTGVWSFESNWGYSSGPDINNYVILDDDAIYSEHAVSPRGIHYSEGRQYWTPSNEDANPGLNLQTFIQYGDASIHDSAEIELRGYEFTFDVDTSGSYTSTKFLRVLDSYNNVLEDGTATTDLMDWARFQVTDTNDSIYVVGGIVEYEERYPNQGLKWTGLHMTQTFADGSDSSGITIYHSASGWIRSTAFFGYDLAGDLDEPLDWYGTVTDETTLDADCRDAFYASFVDDVANFSVLYGKPGMGYTLDAYSTVDDFYAEGSVVDVDWDFTGSILHKTDDPTGVGTYPWSNWSADLDMEL